MKFYDDIAKAHGYPDWPTAQRAIIRAARWARRHAGKRPPAHVTQAIEVAAARSRAEAGIRPRAARWLRLRWVKIIAGVCAPPPGCRGDRARRAVRRALRLYLGIETAALVVASLTPPAMRAVLRKAAPTELLRAADLLSPHVIERFGLEERGCRWVRSYPTVEEAALDLIHRAWLLVR